MGVELLGKALQVAEGCLPSVRGFLSSGAGGGCPAAFRVKNTLNVSRDQCTGGEGGREREGGRGKGGGREGGTRRAKIG